LHLTTDMEHIFDVQYGGVQRSWTAIVPKDPHLRKRPKNIAVGP